jgi:hypothetical protein
MTNSKLYSGFETAANHEFVIKCGTYGFNGPMDGYLILSEFVSEKLIMFNLDTFSYEFIDPRFDSKEYFEGAYKQSSLSPQKETLVLNKINGFPTIV